MQIMLMVFSKLLTILCHVLSTVVVRVLQSVLNCQVGIPLLSWHIQRMFPEMEASKQCKVWQYLFDDVCISRRSFKKALKKCSLDKDALHADK